MVLVNVALLQRNRIRDAAYRYQYALKKLPATGHENATDPASIEIYAELQVNLMLNLSRCKRKLNVSDSLILKLKCYFFPFHFCSFKLVSSV